MKPAANERHALETLEADVRTVRDAMLAAEVSRADDIAAEGGGDLVEPLAMLHQRASDVSHRTVPVGQANWARHRHRQHLLARPLGIWLGDDDIGLIGEVEPEPLEIRERTAATPCTASRFQLPA